MAKITNSKEIQSDFVHPNMSLGFITGLKLDTGTYTVADRTEKAASITKDGAGIINLTLKDVGKVSIYTGDPKINRKSLAAFTKSGEVKKIEIKKNEIFLL